MNTPRPLGAAFIRADGNKTIGMGHLSRAALIAEAFRARGVRAKIVFKSDADAERFLAIRTASAEPIPRDLSFTDEVAELRRLAASAPASLLVLDMLSFADYDDLLASLKATACRTAVIFDDVQRREIGADIVLNGNPCQSEHDYSGVPGRYLVGPRYFLMDPGYGSAAVRPPKKDVKNILLTVGGSDHNDLLFTLLRAFESFGDPYHVKIFSTSSTGYAERLKARLLTSSLSHELFLDVKSLAPFWAGCDAAVTAGGNTLFERIATRLPGATLCQLELQMKIAGAFERMGVNLNLGFGPDIDEGALARKLKLFLNDFDARASQYEKAADIIDGRGLEHLMQAVDTFQQETT